MIAILESIVMMKEMAVVVEIEVQKELRLN